MKIAGWALHQPKEPPAPLEIEASPSPGEVLVSVAGCGLCHTDLGFLFDGIPTRHPLPLILGHEISGTVVETGDTGSGWLGRDVIIPAVLPCTECEACRSGQGSVCPDQVFPGNDVHGGFASHVVVPVTGLCPVPDRSEAPFDLASLSVIADAVSTPYQALLRGGAGPGDLVVVVGAGGVGGFAVQIASALEATVVALDVDDRRLEAASSHGASLTINVADSDFKEIRAAVRDFAARHRIPSWRRKVFETSGTSAGQSTAFGLLEHGGYLGIVGFTPEKPSVRLSNLMALHATAQGNWGCLPEHYPAILDLVLKRKIDLESFVEKRPLSHLPEAIADVRAHRVSKRIVLMPEH